MTKNRPLQKCSADFLAPKIVFLYFLRSGAFRKGPGPISEAPGTLPDQIFRDFAILFCRLRGGCLLLLLLLSLPAIVTAAGTSTTATATAIATATPTTATTTVTTSTTTTGQDVAGRHPHPPELTLRGSPWGTAISRSELNDY